MENKSIRDIIKFCKWEDVKKSLCYYYKYTNKQAESYKSVFEAIGKYRKYSYKNNENEYIEICIGGFRELFIDEDGLDEFYNCSTDKYSLSFRSWKKVANLPIKNETINHYLYHEIIAHFIWEITFYGTEQDAKEKAKKLSKRVKEIKKQS